MKENRRQRLYKKRMAMLLAVILTFTGVIPAGAAEPVDVPVSVNETAPGEVSVSEPETVSTEDAAEAEEPAQEAVSGDETVSEDGTVSADDTKDAAGTVSDNISGDAVSADTVSEDNAKGEDDPADVTIMYYIVGSDLERRNVQATKDIMEIMTGMYWAERSGMDEDYRSKINVIAETGGLSFKGDGQETEEQKRKAYQSAHAELKNYIAASANDTKIYEAIEGKIAWEKNERWVLSGTSIEKAKNDEKMDRDRVMSHHKTTGDAPELEDFIVTTAKEYPAKNYMLVLWDHGGGPEGGYAGDERADSKENGYITSEQLSKTLSDASLKIRESGQDDNGDTLQSGAVSVNAGFEKLAFLGFDACLMGNLETAMAVTPYAEYLFASEDLEAGTGWDHRGYVKTLVETPAEDFGKDKIGETTRKIGCRMADDMMKWYEDEEDTDTISVISLNEVMLKELDEKIGALADAVVYWMLAGNDGVFDAYNYPKFLNALQKSIHFNGNTSGMVDLYSLCTEIISINNVAGDVINAAKGVQDALKPYYFSQCNEGDTNPGPVIYESYTSQYPFTKYDSLNDDDKHKLGGVTVFFPHDEFRYRTETGITQDFLKNYLDIYYNSEGSKRIEDDNKLGDGYRSLLETFCTIQTVGSAMEDGYDKEDEAVRKDMEKAAKDVAADYKLSENSIAKKTAQNMTVSDGLVRSRITVSDLSMKTVVSDGSLIYVYDVASAEKRDMITKITSQMTFTDESGKIHRLGYVPDMDEPEAVGESGKYRFIPKNRNTALWFYIGDVPAAVYNVENLEPDGDPVFFDALNQNTPVLVRIPAVIRRPTLSSNGTPINLEKDYSEETVIIEAEVSANSSNVIPNGYYQINYDQKQLFGFVPWKDVSDYATFWALSDLTEFIFGGTTDFAADNYDTIYSTAMSKNSISINRTNVGEDIAGLKFNYNMQDVFGGIYELDSLYGGERVRVSLTLQKKGKEPKEGITDINLGEDGIYPGYAYSTDGYSLSLNKNLPVGYYDTAGTFHDLDDPSDFKALKPGTYDIVFKYYDNDKYAVTPEAGTTVSVAGVEGSIDPALYSFIPEYVPSLTLTVYDKNSPFTIEKKADMPYGFVKTMKPAEDMSNFVSVKNGDGDVTKSYLTRFVVNINGKTYDLATGQLDEFKKLEPDPGTKMTVSADFYIDGDYRPCTGVAELTIVKQPVSLVGVNRMYSSEFINESIFWDKEYLEGPDDYKPEVQILMQYDGLVYDDGGRSFGNYIGRTMNIGDLVSKNTVSSVAIDISSLDGARLYKDLPVGPKREGIKRPGFWQPEDFVSDFAKYYTVENYEDAVLKEYELLPTAKVTFRSLKGTDEDDDAELCPGIYIGCDKGNLKDGLWSLSDDLIHISGNEVRQWYIRIGDNRRAPVWIDGEPVLYYDYVTEKEKQLVVSENGAWRFYIPQAASSNNVCFYAGYEEKSTTFDETTSGERFNITADYIMPVEYTGRAIVTTSSTKSGSKTIALTLRDSKGNVLEEGKDYTASYKNNKNAAGPSDKKAPTIIVKGKGEYKGFKGEARFTILPADLYFAEIAADRRFAAFTKAGKLSAKVSVKLSSGVKVPVANYDIRYYDENDNEITKDRIKELYKGDEAVSVEIVVSGKKNTKKNAANNYRAGSTAQSIYVTGYPKNSKKLAVKLKKSKQSFEAGKSVSAAQLGVSDNILKSVKIGNRVVSADDLKEVTAYYDKNLTMPAAENGTVMDRAGTYYLAYEVKDDRKGRNAPDYPAYAATAVKFTLTGTKIKKGRTKLENTTLDYMGAGSNVSVNVVFDREKMKADELYLTYTTRDGITGSGTVGYAKNAVNGKGYDYCIDENGKLFIDTIDNGARGSYKLTFEGRGAYTGKFTLTYKVK